MDTLDEAFAHIGVEGYDHFLTVARACVDSRNNIEVCDFVAHYDYIAQFRQRLESDFAKADPIRPKTPLYKQLRPQMRASLDLLREGLSKVQAFIGGAEVELLIEGCADGREAILTLRETAYKLEKEEASLPNPNSSIGELAAMIEFVQKGMFEPDALSNRCKQFIQACRRYREDVTMWKNSASAPVRKAKRIEGSTVEFSLVAALGLEPAKPQEVEVDKPLTPEVLILNEAEAACQKLLDVEDLLLEICEVCTGRQLNLLGALKQELLASEAELKKAYAKLEELSRPVRRCLQCSAEAELTAKICTACGARLAEIIDQKSSVSIMAQEAVAPQRRLSYFVQVEEAIETFRDGKSDLERLQQVIDWFAGRVRAGQDTIKSLTPPNHANEPEAQTRSEEAREHFAKGNQAIQACVRELQAFLLVQSNQIHLDTALEQLKIAEREMLLFQDLIVDRSKAKR